MVMRTRRLLGGLVLWVAASAALGAQGWRGNSGISGGLIFTDNLFLTPVAAQSDMVLQLRPFFSYARSGRRVKSNFNWAPSVLFYANHQDLNKIQHVFAANVNAEIIERYFFIDLNAGANQVLNQTGGPFGANRGAGFDSVVNSNAYQQVYFVSLTPRLQLPVARGRFASVTVEPGLGTVLQASSAQSGIGNTSSVSDSRVTITSGPLFQSMPWSLQWHSRVFDSANQDSLGAITWNQSYVINRRYRIGGVLGYDSGTYVAQNGSEGGLRWELFIDWTPRPNSQFEMGFGQAFYGNYWRLQASNQHKRWAFAGNYRVSVENATTTILSQQVVPLTDLFGDPIVDPLSGDVLAANITAPSLTSDSFLNQQLNASMAWKGRRSSARLGLTLTQRDYSVAAQDTLDQQLDLSLSRRLSQRLTANVGLQYLDHTEQSSLVSDYRQDMLDFTLGWQLGRRTSLNTRVSRQNREADVLLNTFTEHRLTLNLSFRL